jgi:hypothetical protein
MEAALVEQGHLPPGKCIATGDIDGPFIDTGCWANVVGQTRIYLHAPAVQFWAQELLEMVPKAEVDALREQLASYAERVASLERFAEAHQSLADAIEEMQPETSTAGVVEVAA